MLQGSARATPRARAAHMPEEQEAPAPLGAIEAGDEDASRPRPPPPLDEASWLKTGPSSSGWSSDASVVELTQPPGPANAGANTTLITASALAEQLRAAVEPVVGAGLRVGDAWNVSGFALAEKQGDVVRLLSRRQILVSSQLSEQEGAVAAPVVATVEQISSLREVGQRPPPWSVHNTALKYLRDSNEDPPGLPRCWRGVDITDKDTLEIGVLLRGKGPAYTFVEGRSQQWAWRDMLAAFSDSILREVVGCGVVQITCQPLQRSYDHKRHHAAEMKQGPALEGKAPIWDFVVTQKDGTQVRLHTSQTDKSIEVASMSAAPPSQPPQAGLGKSDGPGTYKSFKQASYAGVGGGVTSIVQPNDTDLHQLHQSAVAAWQSQRAPPRPRVGGAPGTAGAAANSGQAPLPQQVPPAQHDGSGQEWWPGGWGNGSWGQGWWGDGSWWRP